MAPRALGMYTLHTHIILYRHYKIRYCTMGFFCYFSLLFTRKESVNYYDTKFCVHRTQPIYTIAN